MFKKGVITDEISQEMDKAVALALKYKLDGIEIRSVWEKGAHELSVGDIREIKTILKGTGIEVCGIGSQFFKCSINNDREIETHMDILKRCIDLAQETGAKIIRGFTFWQEGDFESTLPKIISKFEGVIKLLEKTSLTMALEFDPSVFATNAKKLVKIIKELNAPCIRALWDPGNDIYDPDGEEPFPTGYNIIKPYMVHMHLKDAKRIGGEKIAGTPIGEGQVDYMGQFKALLDDNYKGYVVLETHYRPKHDISEELMALPKGSAFSYMGYEATEECLIKWQDMMTKIKYSIH